MKRSIILIVLAGIIGSLIYLSSIYLVKAELSLKKLAQKNEGSEIESPKIQPVLEGKSKLAEKAAPQTSREESEERPEELPKGAIPIKPEEKPEELPKGVIPLADKAKKEAPVKEEKPEGPPLISMDFENANLKDVLKIFCQQSGLNFIAAENVKLRPITLYLANVKVENALDAIIEANGLAYERVDGSNVFIVRESGAPEIRIDTRIFKLNYAFAEDTTIVGIDNQAKQIKGIKESIQKLLSPNGKLSIDERTNSLIITDIPSRFPLIERSIKMLDMQLPQILIEAKIVELSTSDVDQLGIRWTSLAGYTLKFQDPTRTYGSTRTGGQDRSDQYTTTTKDSNQYDYTSQWITGGTTSETKDTKIDQDTSDDRSLTDTFTRALTKSDIRSAILTADDFEVTLSLLLTDHNIDVISSPNIVTIHGKEAIITIGQEYPIPNFAYNNETGVFEVQGFDYRDIGIILRVTPYANIKDRNISMSVFPEVSGTTESVNFRGVEIPIITTRETRTNVAIKDGDTLAIGGLLRDRDDTIITKVPVLGDIPILGRLFKHKEATKTKTNLIIFITPHILQNTNQPLSPSPEVTVPYSLSESQATTPAATSSREVKKEAKSPAKSGKYQFTHR